MLKCSKISRGLQSHHPLAIAITTNTITLTKIPMLYWTQGSTHDSTTVPGPRVYAWSNQKIMRILGSGGLGWKSRLLLSDPLEELLRFIESAHFRRLGWIEGSTIRTIFKLQLWRHHEKNACGRWASSVDFVNLDGLPLQSFHHQMESKSIPWSHSYWLPLNLTDCLGIEEYHCCSPDDPGFLFSRNKMHVTFVPWRFLMRLLWKLFGLAEGR